MPNRFGRRYHWHVDHGGILMNTDSGYTFLKRRAMRAIERRIDRLGGPKYVHAPIIATGEVDLTK